MFSRDSDDERPPGAVGRVGVGQHVVEEIKGNPCRRSEPVAILVQAILA